MEIKDFKGISVRGLAAYGICCLENAILHYNLQETGWKILLEKYWLYASLPRFLGLGNHYHYNPKDIRDLEGVYMFCDECSPGEVIREVEGKKSPSEGTINSASEEEVLLLYEAFTNPNNNIREIMRKVIWAVWDIMFAEWNGGLNYPLFLELAEKLSKLMEDNGITLPDIEMFRKYEFSSDMLEEEPEFGDPFNGQEELSKILN